MRLGPDQDRETQLAPPMLRTRTRLTFQLACRLPGTNPAASPRPRAIFLVGRTVIARNSAAISELLFQPEEVNVATVIAADDRAVVHEDAVPDLSIAGEGGYRQTRLQVPHLQRLVPQCGNRPLPACRHRHALDIRRMAFQ